MSTQPGTPERQGDTVRGLIGLVARREINARARTKAFAIITALMVVGVIVLAVVFKLVGGGGPDTSTVGLLPKESSLSAPLVASGKAAGQGIRTRVVADKAAGERLIRDGKLDALLVNSANGFHVEVAKSADYESLRGAMALAAKSHALRAEAVRLGADPAAVERSVASGSAVHVTALHHENPYDVQRLIIGLVAGFLIYLTVMTYGQLIAQGVVEEKSSRVVELLLTAVKPWQLMSGKVLGTGAVGLAQMAVTAIAGVAAGLALGTLSIPGSLAVSAVLWSLLWYVLGFFLYAFVFAAAGALVSRQEDVAGVSMPIMMPLIAAWVLGVSILPAEPDSTLLAVLSVIPVLSPVLMPMRIAMGTAAGWEIGLSVALTIVLLVAMARLSGMIYRNSVLRTGARVRLSEALRPA